MPGTIKVSVLGTIDVQTSSNTSIKVAMGKLEYITSDAGDYIFPVTKLRENLIFTLLDVNGNEILHKEIETRMIIESGFLEEDISFNGYGNIQLKMQFILSEEDRNRILLLRQSALGKKHEELVNGAIFTKSKSIASDLSSLRPMKTRETMATTRLEKSFDLSQENERKIIAMRAPVSPNLIMWISEAKDTIEKAKIQVESLDVTSRKKVSEIKKADSVSLVKKENEGLIKPERKPKRNSMRRSMSETNLSNVRKMISTFEVKVTKDTKIHTAKIQAKANSKPESFMHVEKPEEMKISAKDMDNVYTEKCDDLEVVQRIEGTLVIEENSTRGSDLLSKQRRKRSLVVEVRDDDKKPNKSICFKGSQLENAPGSRLWIFPDDAKDLSCETDFGTKHLDLVEVSLLHKKKGESTREKNMGEVQRGLRCRSITKMKSKNKWNKPDQRSKKQNPENSEPSKGPVGKVMRVLIVVGFAGLVFFTRQ